MESQKEDMSIGITGGIGSGKSVVSRVLRCNGFYVYDCDFEAKVIMNRDENVKNSLINALGTNVYQEDGNLNRSKLGTLIFNDEKARQKVNGIVHVAVEQDILKRREKHEGVFFIESAILMSSKIGDLCSRIWLITAPLQERIKRVMLRDQTDIDSVIKRVKSQENEFRLIDKKKTVEFINDNNRSLLSQVLLSQCMKTVKIWEMYFDVKS